MNFTNGLELDLNTIYFSRKFLDYLNSGLSFSRSINLPFQIFFRLSFAMVAGAGDVGVKLAAWQYFYGGTSSP
jgi:hypothetical protein